MPSSLFHIVLISWLINKDTRSKGRRFQVGCSFVSSLSAPPEASSPRFLQEYWRKILGDGWVQERGREWRKVPYQGSTVSRSPPHLPATFHIVGDTSWPPCREVDGLASVWRRHTGSLLPHVAAMLAPFNKTSDPIFQPYLWQQKQVL